MENNINLVTDETVNEIIESLDDFDAENAWYEVWAIGYTDEGELAGAEMLLGTFDDADSAVQYASIITYADIRQEDEDEIFVYFIQKHNNNFNNISALKRIFETYVVTYFPNLVNQNIP